MGDPVKAGLRIASYNIRKAVGTDWRRDPARVLGVIGGLGADIVALQEADRRIGPRIGVLSRDHIRASGYRLVEVPSAPVSIGWHGNALLVREGTGILGVHCIDLPGLEPRGAVVADLELASGPLRMVAVHLGLLRASRKLQLSEILGALGGMPEIPTAIAGDFNERSLATGLGRLARGFEIHAPGLSFHASRPFAAFDRIALGPGLARVDAGVRRDGVTRRASDHLPIWLDVGRTDAGLQASSDTASSAI